MILTSFFVYVAQLKDIAYGTKAHVFRPDITEDDVADEFDETVHLARGENLLEIHLGTARFSPEAMDSLGDKDPSTFCTYAFYDFELQSTAVVQGQQPVYDFTCQYLVKVDDLFLHYIQSSSITVETQLAEGLTFRTIAAGQIRLSQVLEREGKVFGTLQLTGKFRETHLGRGDSEAVILFMSLNLPTYAVYTAEVSTVYQCAISPKCQMVQNCITSQ